MTDLDSRLNALQGRYHASLSTKRAEVEAAWRAACADCSDIDSLLTLIGLVHRLAGSAESYGYAAIGNAAAAVDSLLNRIREQEGPAERNRALRGMFESLLPAMEKLNQAMKSAIDRAPVAASPGG